MSSSTLYGEYFVIWIVRVGDKIRRVGLFFQARHLCCFMVSELRAREIR